MNPTATSSTVTRWARTLLPTPGNVLFTLLMVAGLLWATNAGALPLRAPTEAGTSRSTINYQGYLTDVGGNPVNDTLDIVFRLYNVESNGEALWAENHNDVSVTDGLFSVLLGGAEPAPNPIPQSLFAENDNLWLGISVGGDQEMVPREKITSAPLAVRAQGVARDAQIDGVLSGDHLDGPIRLINSNDPTNELALGQHGDASARLRFVPIDNGSFQWNKELMYDFSGAHWTIESDVVFPHNVGIGTGNPTADLEVKGNIYLNAQKAYDGDVNDVSDALLFPNKGGHDYFQIFRDNKGSNDTLCGHRYGCLVFNAVDRGTPPANADILFGSTDDNGFAPRMIIKGANGRIGVGTVSPGAKLDVQGNFQATGTKSAVVQAGKFGERQLYAIEAPDVRFSDEGLAHLEDSMARVTLDPVFLETIEGDFLIHVTPYGDADLYVAEIGRDYFVVRAQDGDPDVAFAWRLSAHRKGYGDVRLEKVAE